MTVTPVANGNGTATITINVNDGTATTTQTFTVNVMAVNDLLGDGQTQAVAASIGSRRAAMEGQEQALDIGAEHTGAAVLDADCDRVGRER